MITNVSSKDFTNAKYLLVTGEAATIPGLFAAGKANAAKKSIFEVVPIYAIA